MADGVASDEQVEVTGSAEAVALPARSVGRPRGLGKVPGSGRKPGQVNKITKDIKEIIMKRGKPLELLCDVVRGKKIRVGPQAGPGEPEFVYPSLADRLIAARTLLGKIAPDMKATEITGVDGGPIETTVTEGGLNPLAELARRLSFVMASGDADAGVTVETQPIAPPQAETIEQPVVEMPVDPLRRPENQRPDNRAVPTRSDRPQVITRRR